MDLGKPKKKVLKNIPNLSRNQWRKIEISFIKVKAHSGNKYNELADKLAKEAFNYDSLDYVLLSDLA